MRYLVAVGARDSFEYRVNGIVDTQENMVAILFWSITRTFAEAIKLNKYGGYTDQWIWTPFPCDTRLVPCAIQSSSFDAVTEIKLLIDCLSDEDRREAANFIGFMCREGLPIFVRSAVGEELAEVLLEVRHGN